MKDDVYVTKIETVCNCKLFFSGAMTACSLATSHHIKKTFRARMAPAPPIGK